MSKAKGALSALQDTSTFSGLNNSHLIVESGLGSAGHFLLWPHLGSFMWLPSVADSAGATEPGRSSLSGVIMGCQAERFGSPPQGLPSGLAWFVPRAALPVSAARHDKLPLQALFKLQLVFAFAIVPLTKGSHPGRLSVLGAWEITVTGHGCQEAWTPAAITVQMYQMVGRARSTVT